MRISEAPGGGHDGKGGVYPHCLIISRPDYDAPHQPFDEFLTMTETVEQILIEIDESLEQYGLGEDASELFHYVGDGHDEDKWEIRPWDDQEGGMITLTITDLTNDLNEFSDPEWRQVSFWNARVDVCHFIQGVGHHHVVSFGIPIYKDSPFPGMENWSELKKQMLRGLSLLPF